MILIPIITMCVIYLNQYAEHSNVIRALANTWIGLSFFIWAVTEGLSILKGWTSVSVFIMWCVLLAVALMIAIKKKSFVLLQENVKHIKEKKKIDGSKWILIFAVYYIFVLFVGGLSGQYNMDSMVYHLPRIMRWIQNKSVWHFAPGIEFQVRYPCLTEYLVSQVYLMGCSDRLANMVQNIAYICSSVMIYGISRKIGSSTKTAYMAAALYLMMPMALVQSFSTQTDDVAGMFLLTFVYYILDYIQSAKLVMDKKSAVSAVYLAVNAILGYLCKPTICFVMLVFFVGMCIVRILKRDNWFELFKYLVLGSLIALLLFIPSVLKSYQTYTSVDKKMEEQKTPDEQVNGVGTAATALAPDSFNVRRALRDPKQFVITCLQNMGRNSSSICFPQYNAKWEKGIMVTGNWLGKDTSDYRTQKDALFFYQDTASNPCIMFLTLFMMISFCFRLFKPNKTQCLYVILAIAGFLIQCGCMGYTQYRTRYLVGALGVLCPAIAVWMDNLRLKQNYKIAGIALCIAGALVGGINTYSYELPRIKESYEGEKLHQYFIGNPEQEYVYRELANIINERKFTTIGLDGTVYMEYPLWCGIEKIDRMENINVKDKYFQQYEDLSFIPECVIKVVSENDAIQEGDSMECHGVEYNCIWSIHWYQEYFCLFAKA